MNFTCRNAPLEWAESSDPLHKSNESIAPGRASRSLELAYFMGPQTLQGYFRGSPQPPQQPTLVKAVGGMLEKAQGLLRYTTTAANYKRFLYYGDAR